MAGLSGAISGINSNLDTNSIIDALLTFEKQNVLLLQYDQTVKTNQMATYQAINTKMLAFQTQAGLLSRASTFSATKVSVTGEEYLTAIAGDNAALGNYSLRVAALAQNHQIASQGYSEQEAASLGTGTISIAVGDGSTKTINIDSANSSLDGIRRAINNAKVGVTATIVNDGSKSNNFRLMLSADKTGEKNKITFSANLTGTKDLNFSSSSFDQVEKQSFSSLATSNPTLGTTSSYTGSQNKVYTFTVGGNGSQTVGSGDITLNWSDGTNSGSILVSSADTEVELNGAGSDGLKLNFSAGQLVAGDTFRVQTFAPLLQKAPDSKITMGSTDGGGSPITINSESNVIKDVIGGITLNLTKVSEDTAVNIVVDRDTSSIEDSINTFITKFNDVLGSIDEQFKYDPEAEEDSGILFGDRTLMMLQDSMRGKITSRIAGLDSEYNMLASVGIRIGTTGKLSVVDRGKLTAAIENNIEDVQKLFAASGDSSSGKVSFVAMGDKTKTSADGYTVNIAQAAAKGYLRGAVVVNPATTPIVINSSNKNLAFRVDGVISDTITLTEKSYATWDELTAEIQQKINADKKIGKMGVEVSSFDNGSDGYLTMTSGSYGKKSIIELQTSTGNSAAAILGLAGGQNFAGIDVSGTINGEKATGNGQVLTGNDGNNNTAGLKLLIELSQSDVRAESEATIKVFRGVASLAQDFADSISKSVDGTIARRTKALENQVKDIEERVTDLNARMELKRQRLTEKFQEMESLIGQLNQQSSYLSTQLDQISQNFSQIVANNRK